MFSKLITLSAAISSASAAVYSGFNYGAQANFATEFATAKALAGTQGKFASARLYTSIQPNTQNSPTSAIQAAIDNDVTLLLGLWASSGQVTIDNEIAALKNAISQHGDDFTKRVVGISVGSEDLYRISPTGIINKSDPGANPDVLVDYIGQVRSALKGTALGGVPLGHVDTWTAWVNGSNAAVVAACDFLGMDAYPYFQTTQANAIENAYDLFFSAYDQTVQASQGKQVWVTETGWPVSGPDAGSAKPSTANAETYWKQVACKLLGATNTWWYTLNDNGASPSFGVTTGSSTPLYDLSCSAASSSSSSKPASSTTPVKSSTSAAAATTTKASSSAAPVSSVVSSSEVVSSTTEANTASASNSIIPVSSSAVPTLGAGSPGASSTAGLPVSSVVSASSFTTSLVVVVPSTSTAAGNYTASATLTPLPSATGNGAVALRSTGGFVAVMLVVLAAF